MGAGKTTIGRLLAKQMGREFYDSDVEVERKTGVKIPLILSWKVKKASVNARLRQLRS